jgi:hypothetical protein
VSLPASRHLARSLLTYEAAADKSSEPTESAPSRVFEKLRRPLCALAGVAGFRSLLSRALTLARAETPSLGAVEIAADGSLQGLDELGPQINKDKDRDQANANEGGAILIAQLLGLLLTFIGEAVTLRMLQDVWPEAAFDGPDCGKDKKA